MLKAVGLFCGSEKSRLNIPSSESDDGRREEMTYFFFGEAFLPAGFFAAAFLGAAFFALGVEAGLAFATLGLGDLAAVGGFLVFFAFGAAGAAAPFARALFFEPLGRPAPLDF